MFTIEQIKAAHAKVKSGADFPKYVQELIALGLKKYDTFVADGHSVYFGSDDFKLSSDARYGKLEVAGKGNSPEFAIRLKSHQQGNTDYPTFCRDAARTGVEKWTVDMEKMTCTYYNKSGSTMLKENIPAR